MSQYWSRLVHGLEPYVPGEQPKDMRYIKLNTNENPYPPSPAALEAMQAELGDHLRLYPDPNADQLKQTIADYYAVDKTNIFAGNGSDEVLAHTFAALLKRDKPLLYPDISYSFYPVYSRLFEIESNPIPLNAQFEIELEDYRPENNPNGAIIFPNPNAPTGIDLSLDSIETITSNNPNSVVVVDEAYVDFGAETAIPLTQKYNNLLVIQTFSKSRSLAGLRVGFAVGHTDLIEALERVKNSFNSYPLGRLALSGATAALQDQAHFKQTCEKIIATREYCRQALLNLGFEVLNSQSNFLFAKPTQQSAEALYLALKAEGILVRYFKSARIDQWLRITIGTDREMLVFLEKLKQLYS